MKVVAMIAAIVVTLLWSSSYYLNVYTFNKGVGPLTLAGFRYTVAAAVLFILSWRKKEKSQNRHGVSWGIIILLGISGFIVAQGFQYWGQFYLTPTQTSLLISLGNTATVIALSFVFFKEPIKKVTVIGGIGVIIGVGLYYYPWVFHVHDTVGIILVLASSFGYAIHLLLTRYLLQKKNISSTLLVMKPMFIGAVGMLLLGFCVEGIPSIDWITVSIILWLGIVNGSLAFTLWTWSQKYLQAIESSIINNLMLVEIAIFDLLILNKNYTPYQLGALILVVLSILSVQILPGYKRKKALPL